MTKHIRFIEPSFTAGNPSTNGLVAVAERLVNDGWDVEVWCRALDPTLEGKVRKKHLPSLSLPDFLKVFADFTLIHFMAIVEMIRGNPKPHKTVSTGFMFLPADLVTVHFSHFDWFGRQSKMGFFKSAESTFEFLKTVPGLIAEILLFYNPWPNRLLPVSEAVALDIRTWAGSWKEVEVLPNCFHGENFSPEVRLGFRNDARKKLGFSESEIVLAFALNGHFYRKGLADAVAAVGLLRERGHSASLLVIGGREATLRRQKRFLSKTHPDFETWTTFTGLVGDMPFHLSAADAFFFPSRSEAFSLVEIEAAALGLPLFLTPHHGSEMILRDGINGRLLPWNVSGMADDIEEEIHKGLLPITPADTGKATTTVQYYDTWLRLLQ